MILFDKEKSLKQHDIKGNNVKNNTLHRIGNLYEDALKFVLAESLVGFPSSVRKESSSQYRFSEHCKQCKAVACKQNIYTSQETASLASYIMISISEKLKTGEMLLLVLSLSFYFMLNFFLGGEGFGLFYFQIALNILIWLYTGM